MTDIKSIVCPIDFSEPSFAALKTANELALKYSSELCLAHVVESFAFSDMIGKSNYEWYNKRLISTARMRLNEVIKQRVSKYLRVHSIIRSGDPADQIVDVASKKKADVIVMGTHGRTGLSHLILGSITEKVVQHAHCSVVVVHVPQEKSSDKRKAHVHFRKNQVFKKAKI